jgi:predicted metalloprotease with PDZ domain
MSDDARQPDPEALPPAAETISPVLRREALLPNERSRGLGTVAVVCTMAGVASGLALATTLMAMQVADTMSSRSSCSFSRTNQLELVTPVKADDHGFLGIRYVFRDGVAEVDSVLPGTPAEIIGLRAGDHVLAVDGDRIDSANELQERIFNSHSGARPLIMIRRGEEVRDMRPTLISWPSVTY